MALDEGLAQKLFTERYQDELEAYARKNKYLQENQDAEDLMQDMVINVWLKAVNEFDMSKVTYSNDVPRSFNSFFSWIMQQYLANLASHKDTGKQKYFREKGKSLDAPVKKDDEDAGPLMEFMQAADTADPDAKRDISNMIQVIEQDDPTVASALHIILENLERGNVTDVMQLVRDKTGLTTTRLMNALLEYPEFVEFASAY